MRTLRVSTRYWADRRGHSFPIAPSPTPDAISSGEYAKFRKCASTDVALSQPQVDYLRHDLRSSLDQDGSRLYTKKAVCTCNHDPTNSCNQKLCGAIRPGCCHCPTTVSSRSSKIGVPAVGASLCSHVSVLVAAVLHPCNSPAHMHVLRVVRDAQLLRLSRCGATCSLVLEATHERADSHATVLRLSEPSGIAPNLNLRT